MKQRKRRRRGGFTLVETLVAVLVLAMLASAATVGTASALKSREQAIAASDARMLGAAAMQILRDELRYGKKIQAATYSDGKQTVILGESLTYGLNATICLVDGRLVAQGSENSYPALSDGSYNGMKLDDLSITLSDSLATVDLSVVSDAGATLWQETAKVHLLNAPSGGT